MKSHKKPKDKNKKSSDVVKRAPAKDERKKRMRNIVEEEMHEFKEGKLHSGSKKGPVVTNPKQAIAISLSVSRKKLKNK
jgi:hypothetical protein